MGNGPQLRPFSDLKWFQTFPLARLVHHGPFSPRALKNTLDQSTRTLLISSRGARDLRISRLHDVFPSLVGLTYKWLKMAHSSCVRWLARSINMLAKCKWPFFCSGCWCGSGVLRSHIFVAHMRCNGLHWVVVAYISCSLEGTTVRNVQSKRWTSQKAALVQVKFIKFLRISANSTKVCDVCCARNDFIAVNQQFLNI